MSKKKKAGEGREGQRLMQMFNRVLKNWFEEASFGCS